MATRITDLGSATAALAGDDVLHVVDTSDITDNAAGSSKKVTLQQVASALDTLIGSAQNNFTALADPTVNNDTTEGYTAGSRWINTTTDEAFVCVDAADGAAIWITTTLTAADLAAIAVTGSYNSLLDVPFYVGAVAPTTDKVWFHTVDNATYMYDNTISQWVADGYVMLITYKGIITADNYIPIVNGHYASFPLPYDVVPYKMAVSRGDLAAGSITVLDSVDGDLGTATFAGAAVEFVAITSPVVASGGSLIGLKLNAGSGDLEDFVIKIHFKRVAS